MNTERIDIKQTQLPSRLTVLGAGLMGAGIAQIASQYGVRVSLYDVSESALQGGRDRIEASLRRIEKAGRLPGGPSQALRLITATLDLALALEDCDMVIEAAPEKLDLKLDLFAEIDRIAPPGALLGTNTSQFSITELAAATERPASVVGLHFFNPPPIMGLVEIIPGLLTAPDFLQRAVAFCHGIGKETTISQDVQGFIASRGNLIYSLECMRMFEEGVGSAEDIDKTFRLGFGHPMGSLELADYVGLDTVLQVAEAMHAAHGERFRPPLVLRRLVLAGRLGRKSGAGFYEYTGQPLNG